MKTASTLLLVRLPSFLAASSLKSETYIFKQLWEQLDHSVFLRYVKFTSKQFFWMSGSAELIFNRIVSTSFSSPKKLNVAWYSLVSSTRICEEYSCITASFAWVLKQVKRKTKILMWFCKDPCVITVLILSVYFCTW